MPGSRNTIGIKNPAVDALIDRVIFAKDRARAGGRDQGARSRAAVEFLRRAAVYLRLFALCALGPLQPCRRCRNTRAPGFRHCGGSTPTRPPGSASALEGFFAHGAVLPPACARSWRRRSWARHWLRPAMSADAGIEAHGISVFGDLKYPADFHHFDYVNLGRAERRDVFAHSRRFAPTISPIRPSIRSTPTS